MTSRENKQMEILKKVKYTPCCSSCIEDKQLGYGDDIDGCCCRHISPAEAFSELAELDAMPASKEVEDAKLVEVFNAVSNYEIERTELKQKGKMCAELGEYVRKRDYDKLLQILIQAVKPNEIPSMPHTPMEKPSLKEAIQVTKDLIANSVGIQAYHIIALQTLIQCQEISRIKKEFEARVPKKKGKIIVDKFADLMLPEKERLNELEFMIDQSIADFHREFLSKVPTVDTIMDIFPDYLQTITIHGEGEPNILHQQVILKKSIPDIAGAIYKLLTGLQKEG